MTVRRLKTYAAQTGFVYDYYYVGKRAALDSDPLAPSTEYVFDVSADRKSLVAVSIFLSQKTVDTYVAEHGGPLSDPELYAAVKLRLLKALDETSDMRQYGRRFALDVVGLADLLESIGIE